MPTDNTDVLQGTLDMLILKALSLEPMHGWGISQRIQQISRDVLQINQGSLYPALHRLERRLGIEADWGTSDNNRRAQFYRRPALGEKELAEEPARRLAAIRDARRPPRAPPRCRSPGAARGRHRAAGSHPARRRRQRTLDE